MPTQQHKSQTYEEFVEKFKPKKTTDDCMTPQDVYDIIADWVAARYGVARSYMVRPFWPGADYQAFDYSKICVVVDNPPFSILSKILKYYNENNIKYFLFAPMLTCFSHLDKADAVLIKPTITYENGAQVRTAFLTNLPTDFKVEFSDYLSEKLEHPKALPKTQKPDNWWIASECISKKRSILKSEYLGRRTKTPDGKQIYGGAAETIVSRL